MVLKEFRMMVCAGCIIESYLLISCDTLDEISISIAACEGLFWNFRLNPSSNICPKFTPRQFISIEIFCCQTLFFSLKSHFYFISCLSLQQFVP